jgi:glucokinase
MTGIEMEKETAGKPGQTFVGLDIGGTKLAAGLVDATGRILFQLKTPTEAARGGPVILERCLALVEQVIAAGQAQGYDLPAGIGLAAAGRIDAQNGTVIGATDLIPNWTGTHLRAAFEERFGLPCRADNDVNAAALAEQRFGTGRGYTEALFVAAGTGVGGGLISGGQLVQGAHFCAGEIGHVTIAFDGWPCECGRQGCLEQYSASAAIKRYYGQKAALSEDISPTIEGIAREANTNPGGPAEGAFREAGRMLGLGLASLVRLCDPQVIIIGGGLVAASPVYFEQARATFQALAWPIQAGIPVVTAQLGNQAGLIGAACLVFEAG